MSDEAVVVVYAGLEGHEEGVVVLGERKSALLVGSRESVVLPADVARLAHSHPAVQAGSYVRRSYPVLFDGAMVGLSCPINLYFLAGEQRVCLALSVRRALGAQNAGAREPSGSLRLTATSFPGVGVRPGEPIELGRVLEVNPGCSAVFKHEARVVADADGHATLALSGVARGVEVEWVAATVLGYGAPTHPMVP